MRYSIKSIIRLIFIQMCVIAFGIVLGNAFVSAIAHLNGNDYSYGWMFPIATIVTAAVTACLSLIIYIEKLPYILRIIIHFILLIGAVTLASFLFDWYTTFPKLLIVYAITLFIYAIVWIVTLALVKKDEMNINKKLNDISDED